MTTDSQMTDVFGAAKEKLDNPTTNAATKLSSRQKALISTATVLLGGGTAFAAVNWGKLFPPEEPTVPPKPETPVNPEPVATGKTQNVQNGTITPTDKVDIAHNVNNAMTFDQAYANARQEVGPGGVFSWHGQVYNTYTVEEWQGLSLTQRQEFLADVGFKPTERHNGGHPIPTPLEPIYLETIINGRPALAIDENRDGLADTILMMDEDSNSMIAIIDNGGDDRLDTVLQIDMRTQQIVKIEPLDEPVMTEMSKLETVDAAPNQTANSFVATKEDPAEEEEESKEESTDEGYNNDADMSEMDDDSI